MMLMVPMARKAEPGHAVTWTRMERRLVGHMHMRKPSAMLLAQVLHVETQIEACFCH